MGILSYICVDEHYTMSVLVTQFWSGNLSPLPTTSLWAPMIFLRRTYKYAYKKSFAHALYLGGCEGLRLRLSLPQIVVKQGPNTLRKTGKIIPEINSPTD